MPKPNALGDMEHVVSEYLDFSNDLDMVDILFNKLSFMTNKAEHCITWFYTSECVHVTQ